MSRSRHVALAAVTFGVTLGAGVVAENRDAIEARLGLAPPDRAASTSVAARARGHRRGGRPDPPARLSPPRSPGPPPWRSSPRRRRAEAVAALAEVDAVPFDARPRRGGARLLRRGARGAGGGPSATACREAAVAASCAAARCRGPAAAPPAACGRLRRQLTAAPAARGDGRPRRRRALRRGRALTIHHEGLMVRIAADAEGRAALRLPAARHPRRGDGRGPVRRAAVATAGSPTSPSTTAPSCSGRAPPAPDARPRVRRGLWRARRRLVRRPAARPRPPWRAPAASSSALGDPGLPAPMLAEVYTFPRARAAAPAPSTSPSRRRSPAATCGRDLARPDHPGRRRRPPPRPSTSTCRCPAARPRANGWCSTRCSRTSRSPRSEPRRPRRALPATPPGRDARPWPARSPPRPLLPRSRSAPRAADEVTVTAPGLASRAGRWARRHLPAARHASGRGHASIRRVAACAGAACPRPGAPRSGASRATRGSPPSSCPPSSRASPRRGLDARRRDEAAGCAPTTSRAGGVRSSP